MSIRNVRIDIEYDGRNYFGWQLQPQRPTIEGTVREAIESIVNHPITLLSSGRTDAGVHAEQHVGQFQTEVKIPCHNLMRAINSRLPNDIAVYRVIDMPHSWKARYSASARNYRYAFLLSDAPSALWGPRAMWYAQPLDLQAMSRAAAYLVGTHNFEAFRSKKCTADNPERTIVEVSLESQPPLLFLQVKGYAFLRHQVRIMAGTLLEVGQGKRQPEEIQDLLQSGVRESAGDTLPAHGLTLVSVRYPQDEELGIAPHRFPQPQGARIAPQ